MFTREFLVVADSQTMLCGNHREIIIKHYRVILFPLLERHGVGSGADPIALGGRKADPKRNYVQTRSARSAQTERSLLRQWLRKEKWNTLARVPGIENHDRDLVQDLSKRLDALWRYDQYIAMRMVTLNCRSFGRILSNRTSRTSSG